jgi:predicted amidophosphoribosyltransferase
MKNEYLFFLIPIMVIGYIWLMWLSRNTYCPNCNRTLRRAGNDRYCDICHKKYHINIFGLFKLRN